MAGRLVRRGSIAAVLSLCGSLTALAQTTEERRRESTGGGGGGYNAVIDNIDMLVDNYTRFLGRKYDLNGDQDEFTKKMLREKAYGFLDKHENELRDLFDKMFEVRTGGEMSQDDLASWGKRVLPIFDEAKQIVVAGNSEWREILSDQQKTIHDGDLKLMEESLKSTEETLSRIVNGEMTVEEFRHPTGPKNARGPKRPPVVQATPVDAPPGENGSTSDGTLVVQANNAGPSGGPEAGVRVKSLNRPNGAGASNGAESGEAEAHPHGGQPLPVEPAPPANPSENPPPEDENQNPPQEQQQPEQQPDPGAPPPPPPGKTPVVKPPGKNYESEWEKYVREFIDKYKLNEEQTQQANQILKDSETQADKYLAGKKGELESLEKREVELKGAGGRGAKVSTDGAKPAEGAKGADSSKSSELSELGKKRDALMAPIAKIFEDSLKAKLEKLPTRAQRKAAEEATAKKPAPAKGTKASEKKAGTPAKAGESSGSKDKKP